MIARLSLTILALLLTLTSSPSAGFKELNRPQLSFEDDYPEGARRAVRAVLRMEKCEFLGGAKLNGMTSLRYRGETSALNRFLDELSGCLDVTMRISFSSELDDQTDWRVFHEPHSNSFHVEIDHRSERLDLEELVLPEIGKPSVGIH